DKFTYHVGLSKHLRHAQHQIGRGRTLRQFFRQVDTHHIGSKEVYRLTQHSGLGFDPTDAPTDDPEAVYHSGVRIRPDKRIGKIHAVALEHSFCYIFQIHLVNDADSRRYDAESVKSLGPPFQKAIPLVISLKFHLHVSLV